MLVCWADLFGLLLCFVVVFGCLLRFFCVVLVGLYVRCLLAYCWYLVVCFLWVICWLGVVLFLCGVFLYVLFYLDTCYCGKFVLIVLVFGVVGVLFDSLG